MSGIVNNLADLFKFLDEGYFLAFNVDDGSIFIAKRHADGLEKLLVLNSAREYMLKNYKGRFMLLMGVEREDWMRVKGVKRVKLNCEGIVSVIGEDQGEGLPETAVSALDMMHRQSRRVLDVFCDMALRIIDVLRDNPDCAVNDIVDSTGYPMTIVIFLLGVLSTFKGKS
ncbi:MAG: hypothetical protein NDF54_04290 [archaeon GB-1867-035]|nr:hypothetical protein [Candidatus Culexmicrobium profundum]